MATTTSKPKAAEDEPASTAQETLSRRVADELHERIEQAVEAGERLEHGLYDRGEKLREKEQDLSSNLSQIVREHPWAVVGGSVALGVLIGVLTRRR
jgi:ElaB/YqjD/DUF883 family membrane-anchored ribosome-binding protein